MRCIVCLALTLIVTPVMAGSVAMPRFDSGNYCRQVERRTGLEANSIVPSCMASEEESLHILRALWPSISDRVRGHCEYEVRATTTGSYAALQGCVDAQDETARTSSRRSALGL